MAVSSLTGIDESAVVAQAREGDTQAFGELVRRYEGRIFRLAQHVTQNREDAEDVLQETFMKAYEHLDQFKCDSKFYTWIVRIAVNQALMKLRRRKTDKSVSLDETIEIGPAKRHRRFNLRHYIFSARPRLRRRRAFLTDVLSRNERPEVARSAGRRPCR